MNFDEILDLTPEVLYYFLVIRSVKDVYRGVCFRFVKDKSCAYHVVNVSRRHI